MQQEGEQAETGAAKGEREYGEEARQGPIATDGIEDRRHSGPHADGAERREEEEGAARRNYAA